MNEFTIKPIQDPIDKVPKDARCQEASALSHESYIPCSGPAVATVFSRRDGRAYYMCLMCADHAIRNRGFQLYAVNVAGRLLVARARNVEADARGTAHRLAKGHKAAK
jgi:hypothetical protein